MLKRRVLIGPGKAHIEDSDAQAPAVELGPAEVGRSEAGSLAKRQLIENDQRRILPAYRAPARRAGSGASTGLRANETRAEYLCGELT